MKKIALFCISVLMLTGCEDKNKYEQAVLEQMQAEKDIKDYNINPQHMTECVVDLTVKNMPGVFPLDPNRLTAYRNYTKMLTLTKSEDPKKTLEELRASFGSPKDLADAHSNYTESMMNCLSAIIMESEEAEKEQALENKEETTDKVATKELELQNKEETTDKAETKELELENKQDTAEKVATKETAEAPANSE